MLATSIYRVSIRGNGKNEAIRILWPREDLLSFIVPRFEKMCSGGLETCHSSINVSGTYHRFFKFLLEINIVISKRVEGILLSLSHFYDIYFKSGSTRIRYTRRRIKRRKNQGREMDSWKLVKTVLRHPSMLNRCGIER